MTIKQGTRVRFVKLPTQKILRGEKSIEMIEQMHTTKS